ncbi:Y-family DNA polymerase [Candidatus Dojkabacteria bacterium]|jgi:DNA polymerase V|nr:Y-family DNA polymerase [Candidatus Dojkabacteria bacterium]
MKKVFALIDCNNFFVSCERAFNPKLKNIPVVVLSNNDGCMVARSNEARAVGLRMGEPIFECTDLIDFWGVVALSSNFSLYNDLSNRVMSILKTFCPDIEIYSIDEAFLDISNLALPSFLEFGKKIKEEIYKQTGIPVSIGISSSKTLAKIASHKAKKESGVFIIDEDNRKNVLEDLPVSEVWGIGRMSRKKLNKLGINFVSDLLKLDSKQIRNLMSVTGLRTYLELSGTSVYGLDEKIVEHKSLAYTRSFRKGIEDYDGLRKRVVRFAFEVSSRLRAQRSTCNQVTVFIRGNKHHKSFYFNSKTLKTEKPIFFSTEVVKYAIKALDQIYKDGEGYKKAGVILSGIFPMGSTPMTIFEDRNADIKKEKAQEVIDEINKKYEDMISVASSVFEKNTSKQMLSPEYTTSWSGLMRVH